MKTIDDLQDELNESDVQSRLSSVVSCVSDMESCETRADFLANLNEALSECRYLIKELESLKKTVTSLE